MTTLYNQSGEAAELDGEEAGQALLSGQFGLPRGGAVHIVNPDGQLGEVPAELAADALREGYRFPTVEERQAREQEEKFGGTGGEIAAGAIGAARGATLGLSDPALRLLGVPRQTLKGLKEANPAASTGGEAAGAVASLLVPGLGEVAPAGLAAKAGLAAEGAVLRGAVVGAKTGLGRTLAAKALSGAAEGTLYGLGTAISESAIEDTPLTAEKVAAHALGGALAGGGLNVLTGAAGRGVSAVGEQVLGLSGKGLQESLEQFATDRTLKAIAGNGHLGALRKLEHKGIAGRVARDAIDEGVLTAGATADNIFERAAAKVESYGKEIGEVLQEADASGAKHIDGAELADQIENQLIGRFRKGNVGDQSIAKRLEAESQLIRSKGSLSFSEAEEFKRSFDPYLKFGAEQAPTQEALKDLRGLVNQSIESKLGGVSEELGARFKRAKELYGSMSEIKDLAEERALQLRNNRSISPSDYGLGSGLGLLHGGPAGLAVGVAGAIGHKVLRERGPQFLAVGLRKLADAKVLDRMAKAFQRSLTSRLENSPSLFGPFRGVLEGAAARGADDLLATHIGLARSDPAYQDTMAALGFLHEGSEDADAHAQKAQQLEALQGVVDTGDARTEAAIGRFLGTQGGAHPAGPEPLGSSRKELRSAFEARATKLAKLAGNPEALADAMQPDETLTALSPQLAAEAVAAATRAAQFLHEKAPKAPDVGVVPALARPWKPSDGELLRWQRYVHAVESPQSVLAELSKGVVSPESVEALRVVYPRLLEDIRRRMMERVGAHPSQLSTRQRAALSSLFEAPIGGVNEPAHLALIEQAHAISEAAEAQKQAANAQRVKSKSAQALMTPAQRAEARSIAP